ncbi:MAG: DUF2779 domain-containing protein [Methylococcus sp.]|nr:DUF2779 domain-containing protein [Methylococcus sp.]
MAYGLSKSKLQAFLQCPKRLWLQVHRPELGKLAGASAAAIQHGDRVGEAVRALFPNGRLIDAIDPIEALLDTQLVMAFHTDRPLFEATFEHDKVLIRADALVPEQGKYCLVEVKASTRIKDYHLSDCAIQAWVCRQSGLSLSRVELAHVNSGFVYPGGGDYRGLLRHVDLTGVIEPLTSRVPGWIETARATLEDGEPAIGPNAQCHTPYDCPFLAHCAEAAGLPEESEFPLRLLPHPGKLKAELEAEGYRDLREVPPERLTQSKHRRIQRVALSGEAELDPAAAAALSEHGYPRYYLDFESIQFAVPCWAGTRPYQQLVFQWSCHVEDSPGELRQLEFLDGSGDDPRRPFAEALIAAAGKRGPIFVYNIGFERSCVNRLAESFPNLSAPLLAIAGRMVDLLPLARNHYYHPAMDGSWSIKSVLPTLAPDLDYQTLPVQHGAMAQEAYAELIAPGTAPERRAELRRNLLAYCRLDTLAMVRLTWHLEGRAGAPSPSGTGLG